uniref:Group II intron reverse transcriptase/maturase n=1 Tax=Pseudopediastrum sp. CL0201VA TaxID=2184484 RepID=A0A2U8GJT7_9CHLO|nr:Group II intron reverse transcriptase/maturase [Pseudopediastrum sp. CL0201VA]AWI68885.1 Group II intron reverse transcriptase/maturase [Pseudopediastrum sp. CL0201VA]
MSHTWMMENIPFIPRPILQSWLKSGYIELDNLAAGVQETTGIPQGGVISPTIANMVLDGMEKAVYSIDKGARLIRYADDAIVLCDSHELAQSIKKSIQLFLNPRGLIISNEKTKITNIVESFIFVGFRFYDRNGKFYYDIPPAKLAKIKAKVSKVLRTTTDLKSMFIKTNQIIRGFCYAHADANTSAQLRDLGYWLNKRVYTALFQYYKTKAGQTIIKQVLQIRERFERNDQRFPKMISCL